MNVRVERRQTVVGDYRIHSFHAGGGAPLVLLHGLAGSHRWWQFTLPALAEAFHVHVPEMVGFGGSPRAGPQPAPPAMAGVLVEWLDRMELDRMHLVGHSMGGQVALHLAARWGERVDRLVVADAAGVPRPLSLAEAARFLSEVVPPRAWGRFDFLATIARDALRAGPRTLLESARHILEDDVRPLLPRIDSPTLVVWGALDPLTPLRQGEEIAAGIPDARLVVLDDAAHNPMCDRPDAFTAAVLAFLRGE